MAVALLAIGVDPIGAHAPVGVDVLRVHACAGLVNVVKVADAGVDLVVGNPDTPAVLGPTEDGGGSRDDSESGGEEGGELHFGGWEGGWVQNDVFGGGKGGSDVETREEAAGVGDETGSVMMMLGGEDGEVKRFYIRVGGLISPLVDSQEIDLWTLASSCKHHQGAHLVDGGEPCRGSG
jgi:hypothetical protein